MAILPVPTIPDPPTTPGPPRRSINVSFSDEAYTLITEMAQRQGKSVGDVLKDAICFERWYHDALKSGARILVERKNGKIQELLRP